MGVLLNKQRGVTLSGLLKVVVILIFLIVAGVKVVPPYLDNKAIGNKFKELANDPELKNATVHDIRAAFTKRIAISNITAVNAEDIEVTKDDTGITLNASYKVKLPLVGNASLLLEFNPSSSSGKN